MPGPARGAGDGAAAHAAQAAAPRAGADPRPGARGAAAHRPGRAAAAGAGARAAPGHRGHRSRPTPGRPTRCPTTCGPPSGCSTTSSARWPPARTSPRCKAQVAPQSRARAWPRAASDLERTGLTALGRSAPCRAPSRCSRGGHVVTAYPALVDEGATVGVRVVATEAEASRLDLARCPPAAGARRRLAGPAGRQGRCPRAPGWRCSSTRTARSPTWSTTASTPPPTS